MGPPRHGGGYWVEVSFGLVERPAEGRRWRSIRRCSRVLVGYSRIALWGSVPCWVAENMCKV